MSDHWPALAMDLRRFRQLAVERQPDMDRVYDEPARWTISLLTLIEQVAAIVPTRRGSAAPRSQQPLASTHQTRRVLTQCDDRQTDHRNR